MNRYFKIIMGGTIIVFLFSHCKKLYEPQVEAKNLNLLVVEGFINSGQGATTIRLSRTANLKDTSSKPEIGAQVTIEGNNGSSFILTGNTKGEYTIPQLTLNSNISYQLHIKTTNGKEYVSDYTTIRYTPAIDSITWKVENNGVQIYVNTHDDQNNTKFYRWTYSETWEFHSRYLKTCSYVIDPITQQAIDVVCGGGGDTTIYKCWRTQNSTNIILGSSEKLTADKIYLPVRYIEPQADELTILYYIDLKQYALSKEEYLFLQRMKKNTEDVGTLFDPQPSELVGNIHCVTSPDEMVLGYVGIAQEQEKKIFIHNSDLPMIWISQMPCAEFVLENTLPLEVSMIPTRAKTLGMFNRVVTFYASDRFCVDCTLRGTNIRPSFWP